jgi:putative transposase
MPWKAATPVDLRIELMKRLAAGEKPVDLRREYGISKKTVNKFRKRFKDTGLLGLEDLSRAPHVIPHKTPVELEELIVAERKKHDTWGPKKLKDVLEKRHGRKLPSASTVGDILVRRGLVERRKHRPRSRPTPTGLRESNAPNDIWCIDYKGQFRLGDRTYCYPLTLTDQLSRFILACEGMAAICDEAAREVCHEVFRTYGLPTTIRSDNGVPFASTGLAGLTRLSVSWMRLGIELERIRPAHPEENGRHERMHRTLKRDTTRPARTNLLQQQERFDEFVEEFNHERPHEALGMKRPAEVYARSPRPYPSRLRELDYPGHDDTVRVQRHGFVRVGNRQLYLATALAGENVGVREELDGRWLITFKELDLGHVQHKTFTPIDHSVPPGGN